MGKLIVSKLIRLTDHMFSIRERFKLRKNSTDKVVSVSK